MLNAKNYYIIIFICCFFSAFAQKDSLQQDTLNKKRLYWIVGSSSVAYGGLMLALNEAWYKNQPRTSFHFFNDNPQWKQIDKVGHSYSAYHFSRASTEAFLWSGMNKKKAVLWGAISSQFFMTPIEIFDGFSAEYGASWGDLVANFSGGLLWWGQYQIWEDERLHFKFSFSPSSYAALRPNVLGKNFAEQILKDYNGQTYWISVDLYKFFPEKKIPKWLNLALGKGANAMVFARDEENRLNGFEAYRQYYLGLDIHLGNIPTKSKFLKKLFWALGTIRLPAPALSYSQNGRFKWHWLYF